MQDIRVLLPGGRDRSYSITFERGIVRTLPARLAQAFPGVRKFVITDAHVRRLYGKSLLSSFEEAGEDVTVLEVPAGEGSKNADLVYHLQSELLGRGVHRDSVIVAFGGGVVGDLAGFVAATVLRGIRFVQVPTTLLAQVDSSVGGKVGIDHPVGKNLIGAFHQPQAVFIDVSLLRTLPEREFRSGLAEAFKIAAALDKTSFAFLAGKASIIRRGNVRVLEEIVSRSVGLKAAVVMKDEFESGVRKALNLGHTIGHALEAASGFRVLHGEAVGMGIVLESEIAVRLGLLRRREQETLIRVMKALRLQTRPPSIRNRRQFFASLHADKKAVQGTVQFVLPSSIGSCAIGVEVPDELVDRVIAGRA